MPAAYAIAIYSALLVLSDNQLSQSEPLCHWTGTSVIYHHCCLARAISSSPPSIGLTSFCEPTHNCIWTIQMTYSAHLGLLLRRRERGGECLALGICPLLHDLASAGASSILEWRRRSSQHGRLIEFGTASFLPHMSARTPPTLNFHGSFFGAQARAESTCRHTGGETRRISRLGRYRREALCGDPREVAAPRQGLGPCLIPRISCAASCYLKLYSNKNLLKTTKKCSG